MMICVHNKRGNLDPGTHARGTPCGDEGRDYVMQQNQGTPWIPANPGARKRGCNRLPVLGRNQA